MINESDVLCSIIYKRNGVYAHNSFVDGFIRARKHLQLPEKQISLYTVLTSTNIAYETHYVAKEFIEKFSCDFLTTNVDVVDSQKVFANNKKFVVGHNSDSRVNLGSDYILTSPSYNWKSLYQFIFENAANGTLGGNARYDGFNVGGSFLTNLSPLVPPHVKMKYNDEISRMQRTSYLILCGPIYDTFNTLRIPKDHCPTVQEIYNETWTINYTSSALIDVPPPYHDDTTVPDTYIYATYALIILAYIVIIALFIWVRVMENRENKIIKFAKPVFLYIILVGCMCGFSTNWLIALSSIKVSNQMAYDLRAEGIERINDYTVDSYCQCICWVFMTAYGLTFPVLIAKTWSLHRVVITARVNLVSAKKAGGTLKDLLLWMGCYLLFIYVVLAVWQASYPVQYKIFVAEYDEFDNAIKSYGYCYASPEGIYFFALIVGTILLSLLAGGFVCYIARNDETVNSEVTYIALAIMNFLQAIVVVGFMIILLKSNTLKRYLVTITGIFLGFGGLLGLVFVPKIVAVVLCGEDEVITYDKEIRSTSSTMVEHTNVGGSIIFKKISALRNQMKKVEFLDTREKLCDRNVDIRLSQIQVKIPITDATHVSENMREIGDNLDQLTEFEDQNLRNSIDAVSNPLFGTKPPSLL